jgi:tryptophan-rich sensory protein
VPSPLRDRLTAAGAVVAAAGLGGLATDPGSRWFRSLRLPSWYPPPQTFGLVWSALYTGIAYAGGEVLTKAGGDRRAAFARAYGANLALNAAWSLLFFRAHRPWVATAESAVLTASSLDLVRRAREVSPRAAAALAPYPAWTAFATVLAGAIARRN